jgi:hypothetical protein
VRGVSAAGILVVLLAALVPAAAAERQIEVAGFLGRYDPATTPVWPERLQLLMGGADLEGRLVPAARARARAAGNPARFFFYLSFSSLDGGCGCWESDVLGRLRREHPEFLLADERGAPISVFLDQVAAGRQLATDVGNPAYVDWWADVTLEEVRRHGWDGVFADNIVRGQFRDGSWSGVPVDPRTRRRYTTAEYRADMLRALRRLRDRFDAAAASVIGNHGGAWRSFDEDPVVRKQAVTLHGLELEDFAYSFRGEPLGENDWLRQLRYLDFANRHGTLTWAGGEALMHPPKREYVLASYLLTRRGRSVVGDLNALATWWPALAVDLGAAQGGFYCLETGGSGARRDPCPAAGVVFGRDFERARVLVNPGDTDRTVALGVALRSLEGDPVPDPLRLGPHQGRILLRRDGPSPDGR